MQKIPHGGSSRKAFGPQRHTSKRTLGRDIAAAIMRHEAAGRTAWLSPTEYSSDPEVIRWAMRFLGRLKQEASDDDQERRADQQAWLDSLHSGIPATLAYNNGRWLF